MLQESESAVATDPNRRRLFGLVVLLAFTCVYFVTIFKAHYFSYPFHYNADADALFVAHSIWAANDHPITYAGHPGITVFSILKPVLELAADSKIYLKSIDIDAIKNVGQFERMFGRSVLVARCVFGFLAVCMSWLMVLLLRRLRVPAIIAAALGLYLCLSSNLVHQGPRGRSEIPAVFFMVLGTYVFARVLDGLRDPTRADPGRPAWLPQRLAKALPDGATLRYLLGATAFGACIILSVLSKILGAVLVVAALVPVTYQVFVRLRLWERLQLDRHLCQRLLILAIVLFPWWGLTKPKADGITFDLYTAKVFANSYTNFIPLLVGMFGVNAGLLFGGVKLGERGKEAASRVMLALAATFSAVMVGVSLGFYGCALPLGADLDLFISNTHLAVYGAFAHLTGGSTFYGLYIERDFATYLAEVTRGHRVGMHNHTALGLDLWDGAMGYGLFAVAAVAASWSLARLVAAGVRRRFEPRYALIVWLFGMVCLMDYLNLQRARHYYYPYGVFSEVLLCVTVGALFAIEWDALTDGVRRLVAREPVSVAAKIRLIPALLLVSFLGVPLLQTVVNLPHRNFQRRYEEKKRFNHGLHKQFFSDYSPDFAAYLDERGVGYGDFERMTRTERDALHAERVKEEERKEKERKAKKRAQRAKKKKKKQEASATEAGSLDG